MKKQNQKSNIKKSKKKSTKELPAGFLFVNDFDYKGNFKTYTDDLKREQDYVAENIILKRVEVYDRRSREYLKTITKKNGEKVTKTVTRKKKYGLEVYDKQTGKKLSITKFKKYFQLKNSEIAYLTSKESELLPNGVNGMFKNFREASRINITVDSRDLDDLKKYKDNLYYNNEKVSFKYFQSAIYEYMQLINREFYIFKLEVQLTKLGQAIIELTHEIIDYADSGEQANSYADRNGNFILFSSL